MSDMTYKYCINVAACICAKDGIISQAEEDAMFTLLAERFPLLDKAAFESTLEDFLDSNKQIEDYLVEISEDDLRRFTLKVAELSAGADGLDTRENIALEKAYAFWEVVRDA